MTNENIRAWLKEHKKTQAWLAMVLRVHEKTVNRWLKNKIVMPKYIRKFMPSILDRAIRRETPEKDIASHTEYSCTRFRLIQARNTYELETGSTMPIGGNLIQFVCFRCLEFIEASGSQHIPTKDQELLIWAKRFITARIA